MTTTAELLADGLNRVQDGVHRVLDGLGSSELAARIEPQTNTIAWLIWHLTRIQDDHLAAVGGYKQAWHEGGWADRFGLPFDPDATGFGHTSIDVGRVQPSSGDLLAGYYDAVHQRSVEYVTTLSDKDLDRVVDDSWDPPVTLGVRLISVISDDLQHVGQAALIRGALERLG